MTMSCVRTLSCDKQQQSCVLFKHRIVLLFLRRQHRIMSLANKKAGFAAEFKCRTEGEFDSHSPSSHLNNFLDWASLLYVGFNHLELWEPFVFCESLSVLVAMPERK